MAYILLKRCRLFFLLLCVAAVLLVPLAVCPLCPFTPFTVWPFEACPFTAMPDSDRSACDTSSVLISPCEADRGGLEVVAAAFDTIIRKYSCSVLWTNEGISSFRPANEIATRREGCIIVLGNVEGDAVVVVVVV